MASSLFVSIQWKAEWTSAESGARNCEGEYLRYYASNLAVFQNMYTFIELSDLLVCFVDLASHVERITARVTRTNNINILLSIAFVFYWWEKTKEIEKQVQIYIYETLLCYFPPICTKFALTTDKQGYSTISYFILKRCSLTYEKYFRVSSTTSQ